MSSFTVINDYASTHTLPFIRPEAANFADKSFIYAVLTAIKLQFLKLLNVNAELSFSDYVKQQWKLNKNIGYPRSYLALTSFEVIRDRINAQAMKTQGIAGRGRALADATSNHLKVAKLFPVKISLEFHYFESDMDRAIVMVENLATLIAVSGFTFKIVVQDTFEHDAKLVFDDSISIPQLQYSNDADPASIELSCNFTVDTYVGNIEEIARAYSLTHSEERSTPRITV